MSEASKRSARLGENERLADEGSAARTRPISIEEIMVRRKKKQSLENVKEESAIEAKSGGDDLVGMVSEYHESERRRDRHHRDSLHGSEKLRSEVNVKDGSRKKEETVSREERLDKPKNKESHVVVVDAKRRIEGEGYTTERKSRADRDARATEIKMRAGRERHAPKATDEQTHVRELFRERASRGLENEPSRKRLRSLVVMTRPPDENSRKPDDFNKIKHQNGNDTRNRESRISEKHNLRKVHSVEGSERNEKREQPRSHHQDMREKRRRSRSRDHGHDKHRRSSPSPRAEKATSRHRRDRVELSESALKDRPGRLQSGDDGNKVGSNGSSNQSRRYTGSKSGLGGYSPRKRREEAPIKAPSPPSLSAEKSSAKWDLAHTGTTSMFPGSVFSGLQTAMETAYSTINEAALTMLKPFTEVSFKTPPTKQNTDSVQLTESTRRMRRLYVENVPDSVSEKSLTECFNSYMLSSGSNHIQGSEPCISCIINQEKGQALVEFLTPEDASSALSLDGCWFAGSSLKIRRPKDFVETTTGLLDKKEDATNVLSDTVEDSSNKIFISGISNAISSEMLIEIVSAFGPLKAYRFEINIDHNQPCAFLEYVDGSITLKACAGLNGMKLGGNVITAIRAFPDALTVMANNKNRPFYGIPEHAKPLLVKPTHILKLKNVIDPEDLPSISEPEVKELLEDVRLECSRFGVVKSINIVEHRISEITASETDAAVKSESAGSEEMNVSMIQDKDEESKRANHTTDDEEPTEDRRASSTGEDKTCQSLTNKTVEFASETIIGHQNDHSSAPDTQQDHHVDNDQEVAGGRMNPVNESEHRQDEVGPARAVRTRWEPAETEQKPDLELVFEPGSIFVEYVRTEASCTAAHALQGRLYDNRIVEVEYVSEEHYKMRFPK